jgi:transcriptional regulator with XRE-family HTH domain
LSVGEQIARRNPFATPSPSAAGTRDRATGDLLPTGPRIPADPEDGGYTSRVPRRSPRALDQEDVGPDPVPVVPEDAERIEGLEASVGWVIAKRVREYRTQLGLTVEQLADRSGISKGMLSKIENAQASPSLGTLVKLASAIAVPLTSLFRGLEEEHDALLVRAGQGVEIVRKGTRVGHRYFLLGAMRGAHKVMEPMLVHLDEDSEVFPLFQHPGIEFIYMLRGVIEYGFGADRYELRPGDTLQFEGEVVHGPTNLIELPITFLSVIAYGSSPRG